MSQGVYYPAFLNRDRLVHILDPDPSICEALSVLFRLEGFQTQFSVDVASFQNALSRHRPDVVILNQDLAGEDGLEVLRRVKAQRMGTPFFVLEDRPDVENAVRAMKAGAADVVIKPIDTEHLLRSVRDALRHDVHIGPPEDGKRPIEV